MYLAIIRLTHQCRNVGLICTFILFQKEVLAQKSYELGFLLAPVKQSAYKRETSKPIAGNIKPLNTTVTEFGFYIKSINNKRFSFIHSLNIGYAWHAFQFDVSDSTGGTFKGAFGQQEFLYITYLPKINYFIIKKRLALQVGLGTKFMFQGPDVDKRTAYDLVMNRYLIEYMPADGSFNNYRHNPKTLQIVSEIGLEYPIYFCKKKIALSINPFYQHNLNKAYTGVYEFGNGTQTEQGTFYSYLHQTGLRFNLGWRF